MNIKESLISCAKCKGKVALNDLKADKEGKAWICTSCYSIQHPNIKIAQNPLSNIKKEIQIKDIKLEDNNKKFTYLCNACKFKFSRNTEFRGMCPYCGKIGSVERQGLKNEKII